jgi:ribonucleoside-triphosphate reductase
VKIYILLIIEIKKRSDIMFVSKIVGNKTKLFEFNKSKIRNAIIQANNQVSLPDFKEIDVICDDIEEEIFNQNENVISNYEVENIVMSYLYRRMPEVARAYTSYKLERERINKNPTELEKVLYVKSEVSQENANKNAELAHIKNAYLAEIPSKEAMRKALPPACLEAHDRGVVYFHDMAYSAREVHNCELLNLRRLFENGFELGGRWIGEPHSFLTCCTVGTQILSHVTGNTYGGCTINLLDLARYVRVSRERIRKKLGCLLSTNGVKLNPETFNAMVQQELDEEIRQGMQTFDYQNSTLCSNVGQAVFLTVSVYLNEDPEYTDDLILVFKEMLRQRIAGVPNKDGVRENPNFPKILYALDEDTMKGGKYYDITKMCAECSAKRLVPDYMSVKKHMELKGVFTPSMGCRALLSPYKDENGKLVTWGRFNCGRLINAA